MRNPTIVKVIALILAIMLWKLVSLDEPPIVEKIRNETVTIKDVEVTALFDMNEYAIVNMTKKVNIDLIGTPGILNPINFPPSSYRVFVDASGLGEGTHRLPVRYEGFPKGVLVNIFPSMAEVTLESKERTEKNVNVRLTGMVAHGFTAGEAIVKPMKVHVTAPQSRMKEIVEIQALVNVQDVNEQVKKTVPLQAVDAKGNVVDATINPAIVEVTIPVTVPFSNIPLKLEYKGRPAAGYSVSQVEVSQDMITVYAPEDLIQSLSYYSGPEVDLTGLRKDHTFQLEIPVANGVARTVPQTVTVHVQIEETESKTFENVPLKITGLQSGWQAEITHPAEAQIDLTVMGAEQNLRELSADEIQAFVDVSNLVPGDHRVQVKLNLPPFVEVVDDKQTTVTVRVTEGNATNPAGEGESSGSENADNQSAGNGG